ncbi:GNAT family N-acetyltransferase [Phenylobacterium deserti]|uniref:GNAT family N-acetyltransferase n=1 Tax=Phenylobacterium deserti TaxID=1914756 RepID=UPI00197C176F|nr:GNAT family N-acetyltransferase [Phenylobacterium deserti]
MPAALEIQAAIYPTFLLEDEPAFASRLDVAAPYCLAATRDGALVGYLLAHGWPSEAPPPVGTVLAREAPSEILFIHDLAISTPERGLGLGRILISRAFDLAARDGLAVAELIAVEGAAPYWRRLGFADSIAPPHLAAKVAGYGPQARWMTRRIALPADESRADA